MTYWGDKQKVYNEAKARKDTAVAEHGGMKVPTLKPGKAGGEMDGNKKKKFRC